MATFTEEWIIPSGENTYINFSHVVRVRFMTEELSDGAKVEYAILDLTDGTSAMIEKTTVKRLKGRILKNLLNS